MDKQIEQELLNNIRRLGEAITPNVVGSADRSGGHVESLTEAVMGITAGLFRIAESIDGLSEAIQESASQD